MNEMQSPPGTTQNPPPSGGEAVEADDGWWVLAPSDSGETGEEGEEGEEGENGEEDDADGPWRALSQDRRFKPILGPLADVPRWSGSPPTTVPWQPGYELNIQGHGTFVSKERCRYTLIGHEGSYLNQIGGHQSLTADFQSSRVQNNRLVTITRQKADGVETSWGRDRLTVNGNASYQFHSRTIMMSGTINRRWNKGVMRVASMEGIICGGAMTRVIAGPSATLSGLMTADVYGGIARAPRSCGTTWRCFSTVPRRRPRGPSACTCETRRS